MKINTKRARECASTWTFVNAMREATDAMGDARGSYDDDRRTDSPMVTRSLALYLGALANASAMAGELLDALDCEQLAFEAGVRRRMGPP